MATKRQIQANRANARKSTGPRTAMVGCPFLGAAAFRGGIPVFKPQPVFQPVPQAMWQLRRVPAYETGYLNLLAGDVDNLAPDRYDLSGHSERLAALYMDDAKRDHPRLESLARHRVRHERSYYKALHELERLQQGRAGHPVPPPKVVEIHGEIARRQSARACSTSSRPISLSPNLPPNPHKTRRITPNWL